MGTGGSSRVFTLEVDGRPVLAFEASNFREANQLCKERWLRDDLMSLKSAGAPLGTDLSKLSVRSANPEEAILSIVPRQPATRSPTT
jgi:hypothetical protein